MTVRVESLSLVVTRFSGSSDDPLKVFSSVTATWFREVFATPTAAQRGAWDAVSAGDNALVIAPTG